MNSNHLGKHYDSLTPEECFRLILAAKVRGDEVELDRLARSGERITIAFPRHAPFALALQEVALTAYIELIADAAEYAELREHATYARPDATDDDSTGGERSFLQGFLASALAAGYLLKTKAGGWKLFCERLGALSFMTLDFVGLRGMDRLKDALEFAEKCSFTRKGMARWCNAIRSPDSPQMTEAEIPTAENSAKVLESLFRRSVEHHGGLIARCDDGPAADRG